VFRCNNMAFRGNDRPFEQGERVGSVLIEGTPSQEEHKTLMISSMTLSAKVI
jgi:hypothetical protein